MFIIGLAYVNIHYDLWLTVVTFHQVVSAMHGIVDRRICCVIVNLLFLFTRLYFLQQMPCVCRKYCTQIVEISIITNIHSPELLWSRPPRKRQEGPSNYVSTQMMCIVTTSQLYIVQELWYIYCWRYPFRTMNTDVETTHRGRVESDVSSTVDLYETNWTTTVQRDPSDLVHIPTGQCHLLGYPTILC